MAQLRGTGNTAGLALIEHQSTELAALVSRIATAKPGELSALQSEVVAAAAAVSDSVQQANAAGAATGAAGGLASASRQPCHGGVGHVGHGRLPPRLHVAGRRAGLSGPRGAAPRRPRGPTSKAHARRRPPRRRRCRRADGRCPRARRGRTGRIIMRAITERPREARGLP